MKRWSLRWILYPSFLFLILMTLVASIWYASNSFQDYYLDTKSSDLEARAHLIQRLITDIPFDSTSIEVADSLCKSLSKLTDNRITLILASGYVIGDSEYDPHQMNNHSTRPEVKIAMKGGVGRAVRFSETLQRHMLYVAIPNIRDQKTVGTVRASLPLIAMRQVMANFFRQIILGGIGIALMAALISYWFTRQISVPLSNMRESAIQISNGQLVSHMKLPKIEEFAALTETMNNMGNQLEERFSTIKRQRDHHKAVVESMTDALFVVDGDKKIIGMNRASQDLLGICFDDAKGKSVPEVVENEDLRWFLSRALDSESLEDELIMENNGDPRYFQVRGRGLFDSNNERQGAVVVLNEVTRTRRLEKARKDFVSNVSHELRTPVTSIKGFVETLSDGAIDEKETANKFLEIISKQANRLEAIIEDLLKLARLEEVRDKGVITPKEGLICELIDSAIFNCQAHADKKNIKLKYECPENLTARIIPLMLEQAVINLIDNGIKYSEENTQIYVYALENENEVEIHVRDQGCGIDAQHFPRLFERFYRVDKGRSRQVGGTGLGLSIVKHAAKAHKGRVDVKSEIGKGSTFSIYLPKLPE